MIDSTLHDSIPSPIVFQTSFGVIRFQMSIFIVRVKTGYIIQPGLQSLAPIEILAMQAPNQVKADNTLNGACTTSLLKFKPDRRGATDDKLNSKSLIPGPRPAHPSSASSDGRRSGTFPAVEVP